MSTQTTPPPNTLPPIRRIVVSNLPINPTELADTDITATNATTTTATSTNERRIEPEVQIAENVIERKELLGGWAAQLRVGGEERVPTCNDGLDISVKPIPNEGIVLPTGANIQINDLAPGGFVPMHRTTSTDYAIFITGQVTLITPGKAFDAETGTWKDNAVETLCNPGDTLIQRGTLHAWENRTNEWVRFMTVIIGSEMNSVEMEGEEGGRMELPAVFDGKVV